MIVVSDTSPLTYLHQIDRFTLLGSLYGEVVIPPAVERELKDARALHEGLDWSVLRIVKLTDELLGNPMELAIPISDFSRSE